MSYWSNRSRVEDILNSGHPTVEELLKCSDIQDFYRTNNLKLVNFLKKPENIKLMYKLIRQSKDFQSVRKVLCLHISPNQTILKTTAVNTELVDALLQNLDYENEVHRYVIGIVASIILKMFENWPSDTYRLLNNSRQGYSRLLKNIHVPGIFHLLNRFVTDSEAQTTGKTIVWIIYLALIGDHGPGCRVPPTVSNAICYGCRITKLNQVQRCKAIELLCSYFSEFLEITDILNAVNNSLPLLLQDAYDDYERSLVFKLGLTLDPNQALGISAVTIMNCFKSSDLLTQYALLYITLFKVNVINRAVEIFLYRLLTSNKFNNFVIIAAAKMIASIVIELADESLMENLKQIICYCFKKEETLASRSFRTVFLAAANGISLNLESPKAAKQVKETYLMKDDVKINMDLIKLLQEKANGISSNKEFVPDYSIRGLLPSDEIEKLKKMFNNVERFVKPQQTAPKKQTKQKYVAPKEDSDDFVLEEIDVSPMKPPPRQIQSDDEDEIFLEEIDIVDPPPPSPRTSFPPSPGRQFIEIPEDKAPLTMQELLKEPRPREEVPKDFKPTPKIIHLSPLSPRASYRRDTDPFNDKFDSVTPKKLEKKIKQKNKAASSSSSDSSKDDYDYEYELNDEDTPEIKDAKAMIQRHLELKKKAAEEPVKKVQTPKFKIETVVSDMYIDTPKKKPVLNRRVLVVEVPQKVQKLKICCLDSFDDLSSSLAPSEQKKEEPEQEDPNKQKKRHRHNSISKSSSNSSMPEEKSKEEEEKKRKSKKKKSEK